MGVVSSRAALGGRGPDFRGGAWSHVSFQVVVLENILTPWHPRHWTRRWVLGDR